MPDTTTVQTAEEQLAFLHELLRTTRGADIWGETLLWYSDSQQIHVSLNVSDVFAWGGSDCEEVTPENLPVLRQAIEDLRAIAEFDEIYAPELFAARLRGMRPQGTAYPKERAATQALFDACGPAREVGLGNPRRPPTPEDWQQVQLEQDHASLREQQAELRARQDNQHQEQSMTEQFTEYGIRVTLPGYSPRDTSYQRSERDAIRAYDHAKQLHGEEAVEFMSRQVRRTDWVTGKLPPAPPDPDGGVCDPTLIPAPRVEDAGSIDTYEEAQA